jgi:hypothetical protein
MKSTISRLLGIVKLSVNFVAQGLEMKPVTGPVKNITGWISGTLTAVLFGAKILIHLWPSGILNQIIVSVAAVSFLLAVASMLLQWNRSLLWHRSLHASAGTTIGS